MLVDDLPVWLVRALAFLFGSLWGSFFNVAIHRWPREMSIVSPPSHCPACEAPIRPWQNVPILGYLWLRGKARCCGARISPRYFLVELISALLCLALADRIILTALPGTLLLPLVATMLSYFVFVGALIVATFTDLEWMMIPDEVSLPGAAFGLLTVTLRPELDPTDAAIGAGVGFLTVQVLFVWTYERLFGRRGMGEGDAKLLLMIGAFTGYQGALFCIVAGSFQGLIAAGILKVSGRTLAPGEQLEEEPGAPDADAKANRDAEGEDSVEPEEYDEDEGPQKARIPFGPFLALGAIEYLFFGPALLEWYFLDVMGM